MTETPGDVTSLLLDWNGGNRAALDALLPLVYRELRKMARRYMLSENRGHTLEPTALVHEAYLRLIDQNRAQFFGVAAQVDIEVTNSFEKFFELSPLFFLHGAALFVR